MGIHGLVYGNCINMGIRILTSLYFTFKQEMKQQKLDSVNPLIEEFIKDYTQIDIGFIINLVKNRRNR